MAFIDFDTVVVYDVNIDDKVRFQNKKLSALLQYLSNVGVKKIIFLYDAPSSLNQNENFIKRKAVKLFLETVRPRGMTFYVAPNVKLTTNKLKRSDIKSFTLSRTNKIFVQLPVGISDIRIREHVDMIHTKHMIPVFTAFEQDCFGTRFQTVKDDFIPRLLWMKKAYFCLDIRQMSYRKNWIYMSKILDNYKAKILPCISVDPNKYRYTPTVTDLYALMRNRLGDKRYLAFCKHVNESTKSFFDPL